MPTTFNVRQSEPDELYRQVAAEYGAALERLAYAYEADPDRRRDLLQEIHLPLWRSFAKFDSRCSVRTWIYRVAHNVATSHIARQRKNKAREFVTLEEIEDKANPLTADREDLEFSTDRRKALTKLLALIQKLAPLDRQLILGHLEGIDAESMGEITGLSTANIWTKLHRIRNILTREFHTGDSDGR